MHELSIAIQIVEIASREADRARAGHVCEVELDVGTMSGIEFHALKFALSTAVRDTPLDGAAFRINRVEPLFECMACGKRFRPEGGSALCPFCRETRTALVSGQELKVRSIVVE